MSHSGIPSSLQDQMVERNTFRIQRSRGKCSMASPSNQTLLYLPLAEKRLQTCPAANDKKESKGLQEHFAPDHKKNTAYGALIDVRLCAMKKFTEKWDRQTPLIHQRDNLGLVSSLLWTLLNQIAAHHRPFHWPTLFSTPTKQNRWTFVRDLQQRRPSPGHIQQTACAVIEA